MTTKVRRIRHIISTLVLLVMASAAALASPSMGLLTGSGTPLCYCQCERENKGHKCTKMCELPQYENRWWATSCHKKFSSVEETPSSDSNSRSRKTNREEEARL